MCKSKGNEYFTMGWQNDVKLIHIEGSIVINENSENMNFELGLN